MQTYMNKKIDFIIQIIEMTNKAWWSKYAARCNIIMKYYTELIFLMLWFIWMDNVLGHSS